MFNLTKKETKTKSIAYKSKEYNLSVKLRDKILRQPLGMVFTEDFLAQDKHDFILATFLGKKITATLNLKPISKTTLKMRQVAVDDNVQGQGLGRKLVMFSEDFALKKGFNEIVLHARKTAVKFYLNLNYEITNPETFYEVGIPHLKMKKVLN